MAGDGPSGWREYRLGELVDVFDGPHSTPATVDTGPLFLGIQALQSGRLRLEETRHVTEDDFAKWTRRVEPRAGDLVFSYETRLGEAALIPPGLRCCLGRRMGLLRIKKNAPVEPRMLLLAYLGPQFQGVLRRNTIHGSTVDRLPITGFGDFPIVLPSPAEQRAIAGVLTALDDKIESNGRLAKLLRSVAATDYVARAAIADAVRPLGDLVAVLDRGRAPRYVADGVLVINQKCIRAQEIRFAAARRTDGGYLRRDARMVAIGDVLVNSTGVGTLGRASVVEWLPEPEATVDSHVTIVRAASCRIEPTWVASSLLASEQALVAMSEGSTGQTELSKAKLATLPIPMPTSASRAEHSAIASAVADHRGVVQRETVALTALRDALLPKLVSGQIRVPISHDSAEALGAAVQAHELQEALVR